jgi:hypothetical protein
MLATISKLVITDKPVAVAQAAQNLAVKQTTPKLALKGDELYQFDAKLKSLYPTMIGFSYRHADGELTIVYPEGKV